MLRWLKMMNAWRLLRMLGLIVQKFCYLHIYWRWGFLQLFEKFGPIVVEERKVCCLIAPWAEKSSFWKELKKDCFVQSLSLERVVHCCLMFVGTNLKKSCPKCCVCSCFQELDQQSYKRYPLLSVNFVIFGITVEEYLIIETKKWDFMPSRRKIKKKWFDYMKIGVLKYQIFSSLLELEEEVFKDKFC